VVDSNAFKLLKRLCHKAAGELGKQTILRREGLDADRVPPALREPVPQIATQHLRNALAHRIEPAALRV
jgi:hypothetical protein